MQRSACTEQWELFDEWDVTIGDNEVNVDIIGATVQLTRVGHLHYSESCTHFVFFVLLFMPS